MQPVNTLNDGPRIPGELMDIVVDYLHDDPRSLGACALTSKALLDASRYHLFHSITVISDHPCLGFREFWRFLLRKPSVLRFLRHLRLIAGWQTSRPHEINSLQLGLIMDRCPSLQSLSLNYMSYSREPDDSFAATEYGEPCAWATSGWTIPSLTITGIVTERGNSDAAHYLYILSAFRKIDSLTLHLRMLDYDDPVRIGAILPDDLEIQALSLTIPPYEMRLASLCHAICRTRTSQTLRKLNIVMRYDSYLNVIDEIFKPSCPLLEDIQLDLRSYMSTILIDVFRDLTVELPALGIPRFPLTAILLKVFAGTHIRSFCLCSLADVLSALPPTIRTAQVTIGVLEDPDMSNHFQGIDWTKVGRTLANLGSLQRLEFKIDSENALRGTRDDIKEMLQRELPPLMRKGVTLEIQ